MKYGNIEIIKINHDAFRIKGTKTVYIDPFKIKDKDQADFILISHDHYDHLSIDDIKKILADKTTIIASVNCKKLGEIKTNKLIFLSPREKFNESIKVEAVHAYNINKNFHPKNYNGVGFIIEIDNVKIYHAGDTDLIPEMKNLKNIDIALLPVSGTYVMTAEEAVNAAEIIKPKIAIPMHWGDLIGSRDDAENFQKRAMRYCKVEII